MSTPQFRLKKLTIGIRHDRIFTISDIHGAIADAVLDLRKKGQVPRSSFTQMTKPDVFRLILSDKEEHLSLTCAIDGIIIEADMLGLPLLSEEKVESAFTKVAHAVLPLTEGSNTIRRLGIVYEFEIDNFSNSAKAIFSQFMNINLEGIPDNVLMRFSLKNPTTKSILDPIKHNDYKNFIINISSVKDENDENDENDDDNEALQKEQKESIPTIVKISADCQEYYIPHRTLKDINIHRHIKDAKEYIDRKIKKIPLNVE